MDRFWGKVTKTDACWIWGAFKDKFGYGRFRLGRKVVGAHRLSFEWSKGKIPDGYEIDHVCRNPACVNPDHLDAVTRVEHAKRSLAATKQFCVNGHLFSEENTIIRPLGRRGCRACGAAASRKYYQRRRAPESAAA